VTLIDNGEYKTVASVNRSTGHCPSHPPPRRSGLQAVRGRSLCVAALLLVTDLVPTPAQAEPIASPRSNADGGWLLVGGVTNPTIAQPIGAGRALVCAEGRCWIWDSGAIGWTSTDYVAFPTDNLSYLRRRDGNVVVIDGHGVRASEIWSPATGHWTAAAPLPEPLEDLRTVQLADGRIVAAGDASSIRRPRAFVADGELHAWSTFIDAPPILPTHALLVPIPSGALLFSAETVWRHTSGTEGWKTVSLLEAAPPQFSLRFDWGDDVLLVMQRQDKRDTVVVGVDGRLRSATSLPYANDGFGLIPVATTGGAKMWVVVAGTSTFLWRRPEEALIPLPPSGIRPFAKVVALDDQRLLGIDASGAVMALALDGKAPPGAPCDGLFRYLSQTPSPTLPVSEFELVSARCRDAARRGEAATLLALVGRWIDQPERADTGLAFACSLQDDRAIKRVSQLFAGEKKGSARAACYQSLPTWPAAEGVWKIALDHAVYSTGDRWQVNPALGSLTRAATSEVRDRLIPVVRAAAVHHAEGFEALRDRVCVPDAMMSVARRQACDELASLHEADWRRPEIPEAEHPPSHLAKLLEGSAILVAASAVVAGAVVASYSTRNENLSRGIAASAGVVGGATIGFAVAALSSTKGTWVSKAGNEATTLLGVGIVAGGILGGIAAYAVTSSPSSRAPVTGAALAFPWVLAIAFGFD
jgi:hypothetical protein